MAEVNKKSHSKIVINLFNHTLKNHNNSFCGCNYCQKLRNYVEAKKCAHRIKTYIGEDFLELRIAWGEHTINVSEKLEAIKQEIALLKIEKDKLKEWN